MIFIMDGTQRIEWMERVSGVEWEGVIIACNPDEGSVMVQVEGLKEPVKCKVPRQEVRSVPNGMFLGFNRESVEKFIWFETSDWK